MAADPFIHLHLHTEYSLLDGAVRIDDLMKKAQRSKMPAVAMTDHGNVFGAIDFYLEAKAAGIKPIIGCEAYLTPPGIRMTERKGEVEGGQVNGLPGMKKRNSHLTLLASSNAGWSNLMKLVSKGHLDGMYYKPRVDKECLHEHREGIIALSGCIMGEINQFIQAGNLDAARRSIGEFIDIYGRDNFYLEMHDHGLEQQHLCNAQLMEFAKEFDLGLVAANDVHFLNRTDHEAHDVMICIGTNSLLLDENRMRYSPEVYFKTTQEMTALFKHAPEALRNTLAIAEKCNVEIKLDSKSSEKYPQFEAPDGSSREDYFRRVCFEGLEKRYGDRAHTDEELRHRLDYEVKVMTNMGFLSYFLITWDFVKWAKDNGVPVGPGRGSAAGSLVAYCLEITDLCPIRFGLIFERFLNPERVSPPDIDIDFCQTRRPQVIDYVRRKYGEKAVSHIVTFGTLGAKSVVRDVGRVMGLSFSEGDRLAKMIPNELNITLSDARKKNKELQAELTENEQSQQLWQYATYLEGLTRGTGIHAAGIVIGDRDLTDYVPVARGKEGEVVTQFAMTPLTELGMLKMDFLGLKTLTVIQDAVDLIHRVWPEYSIEEDREYKDRQTFDLLNRGETIGVFQLESGGMMNLCRQFDVNCIEDIIALIALYRPGPMDLIPDYIDRKKGRTKVQYLHKLLEEVSRETYGVLIYQEQVQRAANVLAGYSLGEADMLRRAMGKKKPEEMAKQRAIFVEGCSRVNSIPEKQANDIFDLLEKFAGYGFNKSHSAAYGLISYRTAYLKANYPVEFMAALLSNEINNTDKISVFVAECQRMGIPILAPDVNRSSLKFAPETISDGGKAIRFGLAGIKNVGEAAMAAAIAEREEKGTFSSLEDFAGRLDTKVVNRKILESLIKAGAFDWTGERRDTLFSRVDQVIAGSSAAHRDRASGQISLFDMDELMAVAAPSSVAPENQVVWSVEEYLQNEKELLGFYVTGHPLDKYKSALEKGKFKNIAEIDTLKPGATPYKFAGLISDAQVKYTRRDGKPFAVVLIEDYSGQAEIMIWSDTYAKKGSLIQKSHAVVLVAKIEADQRGENRKLNAQDLLPLQADEQPIYGSGLRLISGFRGGKAMEVVPEPAVVLELDCSRDQIEDLMTIREVVRRHPGRRPLHLRLRTKTGEEVILAADDRFSVADSFLEDSSLNGWLESSH